MTRPAESSVEASGRTRARKAVIPAAGLGTRFLPATKAVPKELLPVVDKPALEYVVAEATGEGLADVLIISSVGKDAIADHFDRAPLVEAALEAKGDTERLAAVRRSTELGRLVFVRQPTQRGLGDAISYAESFAGGESFAVLLGDDMIHADEKLLCTMLDIQQERGGAVIALLEVDPRDVDKYGCATPDPGWDGGDVVPVVDLVEKPKPQDAPSNLAVIGRYVLPPEIFSAIARVGEGARGEVEITDAIRLLVQDGVPVHGVVFRGRRFDTGDRLLYLQAVVQLAVEHPTLGHDFAAWLRIFAGTL
ncbi:MAG: UTP--glucose-1-phosphate uridylyltransferase [bacterium]